MDSDLWSMLRACSEAQERFMAWSPTSHHGFESSSTSQGELHNGNLAQESQFGNGARDQSWDMEYDQEETYSYAPQGYDPHGFSTQDCSEIKSLLQELIQVQVDGQLEINQQFDRLNTTLDAQTKALGSIDSTSRPDGTLPTHQDMDSKECYNDVSIADNNTQEEKEDDFDALAHELELELEHLFHDLDEASTPPMVQHPNVNEDIDKLNEGDELKKFELIVVNKEKIEAPFEKKEDHNVLPPYEPTFPFLGMIYTTEVSHDDPMKPLFEKIRMKEFRGWFYDEYDPGDTRPP